MLLRDLIIDACGVMNLIFGNVSQKCLSSIDPKVQVTPAIEEECHGRSQTAEVYRILLQSGLLEQCNVEIDADSLVEFMSTHRLGAGESEAILACAQAGRRLWSDDNRARRVGKVTLGEERVTGTIGILRRLCQNGDIPPEEAYEAYRAMKAAGSFLPDVEQDHFQADVT